MNMKNILECENLRAAAQARGKTLAVLSLESESVLELDPSIELVRGVWDGQSALSIVAPLSSPPCMPDPYEQDLKSLHNISFDLSLCECVDELCREAVRFGRELLDFDRIGIWFVDERDPAWKVGVWGTDESGNARDERGLRLPLTARRVPQAFYEGKIPLLFYEFDSLGDASGATIGRGSRLVAPLWDGHRLIGELGADDLLLHRGFSPQKREIFILFARVVGHLISLKRAEAELRLLASTDSLTGAVNRRTALVILEKSLAQCRRTGSALTVCLADLDGLKVVNDAYGHAAGDDYILKASAALAGAVRSSDTVGRIGGDEFLLVFPDCSPDLVSAIMERVNAELAKSARSLEYHPRLSWGISSPSEIERLLSGDDADMQRCVDMLLELADQRMYDNKRAKGASRPRVAGEAELSF
jgi:diguanylate cyclase (GGDEF) domain